MPISFGAKLSSQEANNTFLDKTIDDSTVGKLRLNNPEVESGNEIVNTQRYINEIAEASGVNGEGDAARNDYSSSEIVDNGDSRKVAIGKLDAQLNDTDSRLEGIEQSIGQPEGLAELDENGFVPTSQLPSFVDDVIEAADFASLPPVGETGKIYVTLDTNRTYRFTGSTYIEVSQSPVESVNGMTGVVNLDNTSVGLANVTDDAQLKREAGDFNSFTEKDTPIEADIVLLEDSEDSFNKKRVTVEDLLNSLNPEVVASTPTAYITDQKPINTQGDNLLVNTVNTRTLNTLVDPDLIVNSLTGDVFTLVEGFSYSIEALVPHFKVNRYVSLITDSTSTIVHSQGSVGISGNQNTENGTTLSVIKFSVDVPVGSSLDFKVVSIVQTSRNGGGGLNSANLLNASSLITNETYTSIKITRIGEL